MITVTRKDLASDLENLIVAQGEPFGSTSIYAQFRVFQSAREAGMKVTLHGQGADELLAGYIGYPGHRLLSLLEANRPGAAIRFLRSWQRWPGRSYRLGLMYLARLLLPGNANQIARQLLGRDFRPRWLNIDIFREAGVTLSEPLRQRHRPGRARRVVEELARSLETVGLPSLLRHGDRNSMWFSIESRVPFVTTPLFEFALSLPESYLIADNGETKSVFRAAMRGIVPDEILDRRDKIGFATPERAWLLDMAPTLRQWLEATADIPIFRTDALLREFDAIAAGQVPFTWQVWRWLAFERWHRSLIAG